MRRILVVEDDHALNRLISTVLREEGYEVASATTGGEALELLETQPELLILDLHLPDVAGPTLLTAAVEGGFRGRVIVASGADDSRFLSRAMSADAYLTKPFTPEAILNAVERVAAMPVTCFEDEDGFPERHEALPGRARRDDPQPRP